MKKILVLNTGSSSLKYQLFGIEGEKYNVIAKGLAERIGINGSFVTITINGNEKITKTLDLPSHKEALEEVFSLLLDGAIKSLDEISGVGHRVVHGGEYYNKSSLIDADLIEKVKELSALAPLHNPAGVIGIKAGQNLLPNVPHVAVFDTAFHQTMPASSYLYALPVEQYEKHQIRKYGFHGTSHLYVSRRAAELIGKEGKIITCHIGNGVSISAIDGGKCVDTSMGLTPLAGVVMGTRTGDIDPYIPLHIMKTQDLSIDETNDLLNKKSGMLGLTGYSDMRDVEDRVIAGDEKTTQGFELYVQNIVKYIGSYVAVLGGVDAIVFTAGVGENSSFTRKAVLDKLSYLGIELNAETNKVRGEEVEISMSDSKVRVFVIPTDEELVIAKDTMKFI